MKTKYKILIIFVMVLSILTCFMITSFAYTTTDITYDNITYTYNNYIRSDSITISNFDKIYIGTNDYDIPLDSLTSYNSNTYSELTLSFTNTSQGGMTIYTLNVKNNSNTIDSYALLFGEYAYLLITGDYTITNNSDVTISDIADMNQYDVYYSMASQDNDNQVNLINYNQPNPLEKVDDFLTYLSTSLNKLTTMILANQILILFIVAVPVVSFVIGSFKRIKDSGRV